ncbi:MAG: hypothetical protein JWN95_4098 [Frankiales bacterium]|nr:hypothetical protein [Frankiales bacterium]
MNAYTPLTRPTSGDGLAVDPAALVKVAAHLGDVAAAVQRSAHRAGLQIGSGDSYGSLSAGRDVGAAHTELAAQLRTELANAAEALADLGGSLHTSARAFDSAEADASTKVRGDSD